MAQLSKTTLALLYLIHHILHPSYYSFLPLDPQYPKNIPQTSPTVPQNPMSSSVQSVQLFQINQVTYTFIPTQEGNPLSPQPVLSKLWVTTRCGVIRFTSTIYHLLSNVREVTVGSGSLSVMFTPPELSCYLEFVTVKNRWRVSRCPSGIPLRIVECTELSPGCRELINIAGCVFKTRDSTPQQDCKPIETRSLKNVMQSLGFCLVASGTLYRVYIPRNRRPYFIVTIFVNHAHAQTELSNDWNVDDAVVTDVHVLEHESIPAAIHRLSVRDKNYGITLHGREIVKRKFKGNNSIFLL